MYDDDGPDDYMTTEQALDAGWMTSEDVEELRDILSVVDISNPTPGDRAMAALILLDSKLNPKPEIERVGPDPHVAWARHLLDLVR